MIFGAEEKVRLSPTFDEKPKSTEITSFWACSGFNALARLADLKPANLSEPIQKLYHPKSICQDLCISSKRKILTGSLINVIIKT